MRSARQQGYVLYTVIIMLVIVAATALLVSNDAAINAGIPQRDVEAMRADYVAEAAMQHALWRKDNDGCAGDTIIAPTDFGIHRYRASIESPATATSWKLKPAGDAWINQAAPGDNFGGEPELRVRNKLGDSARALYYYDLSALAGATAVQSAIAWFYVTSNDSQAELRIHAVTAAWTEAGVTWGNIAAEFDSSIMASIPVQSNKAFWVAVDITALAQQWLNDPASNHGITLIATSDNVESRYSSREYGASQKPYLEITASVGKVSPVTITAEGMLDTGVSRTLTQADIPAYKSPVVASLAYDSVKGVDSYISELSPTSNFGSSKDLWISSSGGNRRFILLRFGLQSIPSGARVLSAKLSVKQSSSSDTQIPVSAHRIFNDWDEAFVTWTQRDDGVNWTTAGGDFDTTVIATTLIGDPGNPRFEWDIRELVEGWLKGDYPNYGVALRALEPDFAGAKLDASDHGDYKRFPTLTIEYACECGTACIAPQGSGRILFVIGDDPASPSPGDAELHDRFRAWGYSVSIVQDTDSQASFDAAVALSDAVFVSPSVDVALLGSKLTNTVIGVVNAKGEFNDELGIASGAAWPVGDAIDIVDVDHYITSVFPPGPIAINRGHMEGLTSSGSESPGAQRLADWGSQAALLILNTGDELWKSGSAAGRRVMVPLGREANVHPGYWTNSGALIVQRALAWAAEADVAGRRLLMVVGNANNLTVVDIAEIALLKSWGYDVRPISSNQSQAQFATAASFNDVVYVTDRAKANEIGTKLAGANIGVVLAQPDLVAEFGFADDVNLSAATDISVDNSYYVTATLPSGPVTLLSASDDFATLAGNMAAGLDIIAQLGGGPSLVALEAAAETLAGPAAGRRILLPWSNGGFDVAALNDTGLELFQRSLQWAADGSGTLSSIYSFSTDKDAEVGGLSYREEDLVAYTPWNDSASLLFDGGSKLKKGKINALHVLADGRLLLATKGDGELGGLNFTDSDLVRYDPVLDSAALVFEGASLFTESEKINAVHVLDNGHLLLATDKPATLGGLDFTEYDLVEYDPVTDTATLFFDGSTTTLNNKITGVHVLSNGHLVLTTKGATTLGGLSFDAADLVDYNPVDDVAKMVFDGSELFKDADEKINSIHIGPGSGAFGSGHGGNCDGNFRDEFNSISFVGSDGSLSWSNGWEEVGESDGANDGDVEVANDISNYQLVIGDNNNGGEGVWREFDLSGATTASLSYRFRRNLNSASDYATVAVRDATSTGPWTELARHEGPANDSSYQSLSHDISAFISGRTRVRFLTASSMGNDEELWLDDIDVLCEQ